jgi:ABC-type nitrate/sulfonate/bicarbonate transport system permease component
MKPETKSTIKSTIWGAVGGAVAAIIIGFAWGGWTTSGTTQRMTDEALLASRAVPGIDMKPSKKEAGIKCPGNKKPFIM